PLDIVRISTALFVQIEQNEWTGVFKKEVKNFENVLERVINNSSGYEKTMWKRIETELEEVDIESLGFNHPLCSGVLD
ncbi:15495_t:CDS:2, partial [Funneliformis geosporum]